LRETQSNIIRVIKSRKMKWEGHVARTREMRKTCKIFAGKPEGNRLLERYKHRWEDNIRMDNWQLVWEGVDWIYLAQDRDQCGGLS
jgi:hypothetical protein